MTLLVYASDTLRYSNDPEVLINTSPPALDDHVCDWEGHKAQSRDISVSLVSGDTIEIWDTSLYRQDFYSNFRIYFDYLPPNITAVNMTVTPSESPCIQGECTVTVGIT